MCTTSQALGLQDLHLIHNSASGRQQHSHNMAAYKLLPSGAAQILLPRRTMVAVFSRVTRR
jgi:hypothetical protein